MIEKWREKKKENDGVSCGWWRRERGSEVKIKKEKRREKKRQKCKERERERERKYIIIMFSKIWYNNYCNSINYIIIKIFVVIFRLKHTHKLTNNKKRRRFFINNKSNSKKKENRYNNLWN